MTEKTQKPKRSKKVIVYRVLAAILLLVGLVLTFNVQIRNYLISQNQSSALTNLTQKKVAKNRKKQGMFDFKKVKEVDFNQVLKAKSQNNAHVIGAISIPDVNLNLPICLGLSDSALTTGAGTMREDQKMGQGNYPLAGHYMTAKGILFSPLEDTKLGERVYLTDLKHIYVYRIYMKKKVNPYAVYLVNNTKQKIVTLITCADGGVNRWAVRGNLMKTEKASKTNLKVFNFKS